MSGILKSSLKLSSSQGVASVLNFLAIAFFARTLGPGVWGIFVLFQSVGGLVKLLSNFGLRTAMEKRLSERENQSEILSTAIVLRVALLLPFVLAIVGFRAPVAEYIGAEVIPLLIVVIIIEEAGQFVVFALKGELRVGETAELQVVQQVGWAVVGILLVLAGMGVRALIYAALLGATAKLLWGMHKLSISPGPVSLEGARDLLRLSSQYFVPAMNSLLYRRLDVLIIGYFVGQTAVGAYEAAWRVGSVMLTFSKALANSLFPQVSSWAADAEGERIAGVVPKAIVASALFAIPGFFGVIVLSEEILDIIFSSDFVFVATPLAVLAGARAIESSKLIVAPTLRAIGQASLSTKAALVGGVTNLILNVVLVSQLQVIGAAIATTIAIAVTTLLHYYYLQQFVDFQFPTFELSWLLVSAAMMGGIVATVKRYLAIQSIWILLFVVGLGASVYFATVVVHPSLRNRLYRNVSNYVPS